MPFKINSSNSNMQARPYLVDICSASGFGRLSSGTLYRSRAFLCPWKASGSFLENLKWRAVTPTLVVFHSKLEMEVFCISKQVNLRFSLLLLVQEVTYFFFFFLSLAPLEKSLELSWIERCIEKCGPVAKVTLCKMGHFHLNGYNSRLCQGRKYNSTVPLEDLIF